MNTHFTLQRHRLSMVIEGDFAEMRSRLQSVLDLLNDTDILDGLLTRATKPTLLPSLTRKKPDISAEERQRRRDRMLDYHRKRKEQVGVPQP